MDRARKQIIVVLNEPAKSYRDSGNVRELALTMWAKEKGADIWVIRDQAFAAGRLARVFALAHILMRLWRQPGAVVIMGYPAFPFFWSLDSVSQLLRAFAFVAGCKLVGIFRGQRIIVDIMDLPRLQHVDLHYEVKLPLWLLKLYDRCVYHLATQLWVCSGGIADRIKSELFWGRDRAVTVENGAFPSEYDVPENGCRNVARVFIYAGQLLKTRGITELIDEFRNCRRDDVELRLCGGGGDWIPDYVSDPRVRYLGKLNEDDCAKAVADCDVGIVFQPKGIYYDMVFPTKLPLYLARGKPVIATDNPELARSVEEKGVGVIASQDKIADMIDSMTADSMAACAARANEIREDVYWNSIYDRAFSKAFIGA